MILKIIIILVLMITKKTYAKEFSQSFVDVVSDSYTEIRHFNKYILQYVGQNEERIQYPYEQSIIKNWIKQFYSPSSFDKKDRFKNKKSGAY
jgi:hypothetical protein